jgi:hypothetical protein
VDEKTGPLSAAEKNATGPTPADTPSHWQNRAQMEIVMRRPPQLASVLLYLAAVLPLPAAGRDVPAVFFVFTNPGKEPYARVDLWDEVVAGLMPEHAGVVIEADDPRRIIKVANLASSENASTIAIGIASAFYAGDMSGFPDAARSFREQVSADFSGLSYPAEIADIVTGPDCVAFQQSLAPGEYVSRTYVVLPEEDAAARACIEKVARTLFDRADGAVRSADGTETAIIDETADTAQEALRPIRANSARLITDIGTRQRRDSNVYAPDEKIEALFNFGNVSRTDPGRPGARYRLAMDIHVQMKDGPSRLLKEVAVYEGEATPRIPTDAIYFQNWVTAGIVLPQPGEYVLTFSVTDILADPDGREAAQVDMEVVVE